MAFGIGKRWWRKQLGISNAQRQLSRKIGIPLSGRRSRRSLIPKLKLGGGRGSWTRRPQNHCRECNHIWYPRGHDRAAQCPQCGSERIELMSEAMLRDFLWLVALPFTLAGLVIGLLLVILTAIASALWELCRLVARGAGAGAKLAAEGTVAASAAAAQGAAEVAEASEPARNAVLAWIAEMTCRGIEGLVLAVRWVLSIREDLFGDEDQDINAASLIGKVVVILVVSWTCIVLTIELFRGRLL